MGFMPSSRISVGHVAEAGGSFGTGSGRPGRPCWAGGGCAGGPGGGTRSGRPPPCLPGVRAACRRSAAVLPRYAELRGGMADVATRQRGGVRLPGDRGGPARPGRVGPAARPPHPGLASRRQRAGRCAGPGPVRGTRLLRWRPLCAGLCPAAARPGHRGRPGCLRRSRRDRRPGGRPGSRGRQDPAHQPRPPLAGQGNLGRRPDGDAPLPTASASPDRARATEPDRRALADPPMASAYLAALREALRPGAAGAVQDMG